MKKRILGALLVVLLAISATSFGTASVVHAAETSYGIPDEMKTLWHYVGQSAEATDARTWMQANAYNKKPYGSGIDTSQLSYKNAYDKLHKENLSVTEEFLAETKICILYLPNCPYSKTYLPMYQKMAQAVEAKVLLADILNYQTASLLLYYNTLTDGAASPIVLWVDKDGKNHGSSACHSIDTFKEILEDCGYDVPSDALPDDSDAYSSEQEYKNEIINQVNRERIKENRLPLSTYQNLQDVADIRAEEIVADLSHQREDGSWYYNLMEEKGLVNLDLDYTGENICAGSAFSTPLAAMRGWMNSPGHRANILSENFTHIGAGYYNNQDNNQNQYKDHWVQLFVGLCKVDSISLSQQAVKVVQGVPISDMDLTVTLHCSRHGDTTMPLIDEMCTGYDSNKEGLQGVTVHYGDLTKVFEVTVGESKSIELTDNMVSIIEDEFGFTYDGTAKEPSVSVMNKTGDYTLVEGYSYTIEYSNNIDAGTASVTVTGKGNYTGSITKTFEISPRDIGNTTIDGIAETYEYTGKEVTPKVTVTDGVIKLYEGDDFTVTYADNVGAISQNTTKPDIVSGNATVTITGIGNYTGTTTRTFGWTMNSVHQAAESLSFSIGGGTYTGAELFETLEDLVSKGQMTQVQLDARINDILARIKEKNEAVGLDNVLACTLAPKVNEKINSFYKYYNNKKQGIIAKINEPIVTTKAVDTVSIQGVENVLTKSADVQLTVSNSVEDITFDPASYDSMSMVALDIDLLIDGVAQDKLTANGKITSVPDVTITMNLPNIFEETDDLVVLHYADGTNKAPEELAVLKNGDRTISFVTDSFSTFVITKKLPQYSSEIEEDTSFGEKVGVEAPSGIKAYYTGNDIVVSWETPAKVDAWTVTDYKVTSSNSEDMSDPTVISVGADQTETVLKDVEPGTYYITVSTISALKDSLNKEERQSGQFIVVVPETTKLILNSNPSGVGTLTGGGVYTAGKEITISAAAVYGYTFQGWDTDGDGKVNTTDIETTVTIPEDTAELTCTAIFEKDEEEKFTLTVAGGTADQNQESYAMNTLVTVQANQAEDGKKFSHWEDGNGNETSYSESYSFYIKANMELTAVYVEDTDVVEKKGVIAVVNSIREKTDTAQQILYGFNWEVPEGSSNVSYGVVYSLTNTNPEIGGAGVTRKVYTSTKMVGCYNYTLTLKSATSQASTVYVKGYLTYTKAGETTTIYTDVSQFDPISSN